MNIIILNSRSSSLSTLTSEEDTGSQSSSVMTTHSLGSLDEEGRLFNLEMNLVKI